MALEDVDRFLLEGSDDLAWELFHENSKTSRREPHPSYRVRPTEADIVRVMNGLRRTRPYRDRPKIVLPTEHPSAVGTIDELMAGRRTARAFAGTPIALEQLAKVLWSSYGVTATNDGTTFPRPFRAIPSGGALYPLELYVLAGRVEGLEPALFHYDPEEHQLARLRSEPDVSALARFFVQPELVSGAAAIVFITAIFIRSIFKYGDRGYRFVLLEAGHLAQNAALCAEGLGLCAAEVGGYFDRDVDRYLGVDGLSESTIYTLLVGAREAAAAAADTDDRH